MEWNQDIFIKNIDEFLVAKFDGNQTKFNDAINSRDAVTRWRRGERPSLAALLKVTELCNCTVDSLLMEQKTPYYTKNKALHDIVELILEKEDQTAINAMEYGIRGILASMNVEAKLYDMIQGMQERINDLENELKREGTTVGATGVPEKTKSRNMV